MLNLNFSAFYFTLNANPKKLAHIKNITTIEYMLKKKDLPLIILKTLEPYVKLKNDKFEVVHPKENLLKIIDKDPETQFHFTIEKFQINKSNSKILFLMTKIPKSDIENGVFQTWIEIGELNANIEIWTKFIKEFKAVNSFYDDPVLKTFSDEFYAEFEIIDEYADTNPFSTKQILLLDEYLEKVDKKLLEFETEKNAQDIREIKEEIISLRENLTTKSKQWVVKNLTTIWAKIAKQGPKFIKEFLSESKKEIIKQGVKGLLDYVKENGMDYIN